MVERRDATRNLSLVIQPIEVLRNHVFAAKRVFGPPLRFPPSTTLTDWLWAVAFSNATCAIALPLPSRADSVLPLSDQVPPIVVLQEGFEPPTHRA